MSIQNRKQSIIKSIESQTDAGFSNKDIFKNLLNEGYTEEEINPVLNPFSTIPTQDKKSAIIKSVVTMIVAPILSFVLVIVIYFSFFTESKNETSLKVIGGMGAISLIGIVVGIYKFVSVCFMLYEVPKIKQGLIWVAIILLAIFIGIQIDAYMTKHNI